MIAQCEGDWAEMWRVPCSSTGRDKTQEVVEARALLRYPCARYRTPKCSHGALDELVPHSLYPAFTHMQLE